MLECPETFKLPFVPDDWSAVAVNPGLYELQPPDRRAAVHISIYRRAESAVQGRWLRSMLRGHYSYAVPGYGRALATMRRQVTRLWLRSLRSRSQRHRLTWVRMDRLVDRWLPPVRILHPYPEARFAATTRGRSPVR